MKSLSPAVVALWFASLALVPATRFYAVYGHYTIESYLGFYILPLVATFLCAYLLYPRLAPASAGRAMVFGGVVAVVAVLVVVALQSLLVTSFALASNASPLSFLGGIGMVGFIGGYTLFFLVVGYFPDLLQALGVGLVGGIGVWVGQRWSLRLPAIVSGLILGISLIYLHALPDPTLVLSHLGYQDAELVTERDFQQVMSYDYEEKTVLYRSRVAIAELFDHCERAMRGEGWRVTSRSATRMVFQHPVSHYTIFIEEDATDPMLIKAVIRRKLFLN